MHIPKGRECVGFNQNTELDLQVDAFSLHTQSKVTPCFVLKCWRVWKCNNAYKSDSFSCRESGNHGRCQKPRLPRDLWSSLPNQRTRYVQFVNRIGSRDVMMHSLHQTRCLAQATLIDSRVSVTLFNCDISSAMAAAELCPMPIPMAVSEYHSKHGSSSTFRTETISEVEPGAIENLILSLNSEGFTLKELTFHETSPSGDEKKKNKRRQGKKR